ncbi:MAG: hypothetical protein NT069_33215 [Planctomycetota bacterium]|nr:hypothetical protein [Planctomycetota bacterium]
MSVDHALDSKQAPMSGSRLAGERLSEQACAVSRDIQGMGVVVKDLAQEALVECEEGAATVYREGRDKVRDATRTLERFIEEQPLTSVLIAAGVGMFLGRFWTRP